MKKNHYDNLQVARHASSRVIRSAYKSLSQEWHPDKHPNNKEEAERIIKIINKAYEVLKDPDLRKKHDEWIDSKQSTVSKQVNEKTKNEEVPDGMITAESYSKDRNTHIDLVISRIKRGNYKGKEINNVWYIFAEKKQNNNFSNQSKNNKPKKINVFHVIVTIVVISIISAVARPVFLSIKNNNNLLEKEEIMKNLKNQGFSDHDLAEAFKKIKSLLPKKINNVITIKDIYMEQKTIKYSIQVYFEDNMTWNLNKNDLLDSSCKNKNIRIFFKGKIDTIEYSYFDKNGDFMKSIAIHKNDCD